MPSLFVRDQFTWLAYAMSAYFSYLQAALAPAMVFLSTELNLNYSLSGLHSSLYAIGMVLAGSVSAAMTRRWGRRFNFWGGAIGMGVGALLLVLSPYLALTLPSAGLMGFSGAVLIMAVNAALSDRHREHRTVALTEVNVAASLSACFVPFLIGQFYAIGLGWRAGLYVAIIALTIMLRRWNVLIPNQPSTHDSTAPQLLSKQFWMYWLILFFGVSIEFCVYFWSAFYLKAGIGLTQGDAVSATGILIVGSLIGRVVISRFSRSIQTEKLLISAIALTWIGFPIFWLASIPSLNLVGLFILGFGISNFYPLITSLALGVADSNADRATARLAIGVGLAIAIAPFVLGAIADQIALKQAYALVIVLLSAMTCGVWTSQQKPA